MLWPFLSFAPLIFRSDRQKQSNFTFQSLLTQPLFVMRHVVKISSELFHWLLLDTLCYVNS